MLVGINAIDHRFNELQQWVASQVQPVHNIIPLTGDASFRRYFRVFLPEKTYIAVDAPPLQEDSSPFIAIAKTWRAIGLHVPNIIAFDLQQGFMLLTDLGDDLYLRVLNEDSVDDLYQRALQTLLKLQTCHSISDWTLPDYDEKILREELHRFKEWYLTAYLNIHLSRDEESLLNKLNDLLISSALEQIKVCVHRDYHSRNLLLLKDGSVGIIDFQDAVWGPVTYDLVSLLRDCYITWPTVKVEKWVMQYQQMAFETGILEVNNPTLFLKWFDYMGLQRHLKVLGTFARLYRRDRKPAYLADIPRILEYVYFVCSRHTEFSDFKKLLERIL